MLVNASPPMRPARILIVDDNDENRELLQIILGSEGFALSTASNALPRSTPSFAASQ